MISAIKKRINTKILSYIDYAVSKRATDNARVIPCRVKGHVVLLEVETDIERFRAESLRDQGAGDPGVD